jgi:hypothetical protein
MTTDSKSIQHRAAAATMKEQRAREAVEAMQEYEAEKLAIRANTARLRALRLATQAGRMQEPKTGSPVESGSSRARHIGGR